MPDAAALTMTADVLDRALPALSATSDAPDTVPSPALSEEVVKPRETIHVRDEKTGRFKTVDKPAEQPQDTPTVEGAKPETVEPTAGDKQAVEVTATDPKAEDEPSPAQRAAFARMKAQLDAQQAEIERLAALVPRPEAPKPQPEPNPDDFADPNAYDSARLAWARAEGAREALEKAEQERAKSEAMAQSKVKLDAWTQRLDAFRSDHPDYAEKAEAPTLRISVPMSNAIMALDNGPQVAYHLGENPDESARIAGLSPLEATVEIGKLAARLSAPVKAPSPKPKPAPIVPVGERSAPDVKSADEMTTEEYAESIKHRLAYGRR